MQVASTLAPGVGRVSRSGAHAAPNSILVGLIGRGIQLSRSPALHEAEGARQGLTYIYRLIDLDVLGLGVDASPILLRRPAGSPSPG